MNKKMSKEALHVELALAMRKEQDEYHNWLMSQDVATVIAHADGHDPAPQRILCGPW